MSFQSCSEISIAREGWSTLDLGALTVQFPSQWRAEKFASIEGDAFYELFENEQRVVVIELSPYAPSIRPHIPDFSPEVESIRQRFMEIHKLTEGAVPRDVLSLERILDIKIDGRRCQLSIPRYPDLGLLGVEFHNLGMNGSFVNRLYIGGRNLSQKNQGLLLEAIFTIKFIAE